MISCKISFLSMALAISGLSACAMEQISFDKDPCNAQVQFAAGAEAYSLAVSFAPVRLFSSIKNTRINLNKAKIYALTALSRKLKVDKNSALIVSDMKFENCQSAENSFSCSLSIPVKDVHIVERANIPDGKNETFFMPGDIADMPLLNYKESIRRILIENWKEWKSGIEQVVPDQETADNLSGIEDEINSEFDNARLQKKFESDVMLFEGDVRELQNMAEKVKNDLLIRCEIRLMEYNLKSNAVQDRAKYQSDIKAKERQTIDVEKI